MLKLDKTLILSAAAQFDIDPLLVSALILTESSGDPCAFRYEPAFYKKYIARRTPEDLGGYFPCHEINVEAEKILRSCSFGLCQIMGQVARELGFRHMDMFTLLDPKTNLQFGLQKLEKEIVFAKRHLPFGSVGYTYEKALLRYNGGGDPNYGQVVLKKMQDNSAHKFLYG
jgi:hypothetical protein